MFGMLFYPVMNPPDDERAKPHEDQKDIQSIFRNYPIEKVMDRRFIGHGTVSGETPGFQFA